VQGAWIEAWDRPKRLSRQRVSIKHDGEASFARWQESEQTPEELHISIFDPEVPLVCIDDCRNGPGSGEHVSEVLAGKKPDEDPDANDPPAYLMDDPALAGTPIRIAEGAGDTRVVLSGENLTASSRVYLVIGARAPQESKASKHYLNSSTLDLRHVQVTIPSALSEKPGMLTAYAEDSWVGKGTAETGTGQKIIVASMNSPAISSVEPQVLRCLGLDAAVVLRGSGFTEQSEVTFGDDFSSGPQVKFVSGSELHVEIPASELADFSGRFARVEPVTLSVTNDPLHFSTPAALRVAPCAKMKREPVTAVLHSITPYPIPMMDSHSPPYIALEIDGANFRPNDVVSFHYGDHDYRNLKTQYLSARHLKAWLPRETWRKHRLSFRLVVQTSQGFCAAEAFEESLE
jgi:hypothetical protein